MATIKEMLSIAGSIENAEKMAKQLIKERGDQHLLDLELLYGLQGKISESWEICERAMKVFPNDNRVAYNRGWHVMLQGDLLGGFTLMNKGRSEGLWGNPPLETTKPIWDGEENIEGKHILFSSEAGFGDEIAFSRFAKELGKMGAKVTFICSETFMSLMARIPEFSAVVRKEAALSVYHDYWLPSMLSPVTLKKQFKDLSGKPYLVPSPEYVEKFSHYVKSDKLKVGFRWLGREGEDYVNRIFPRDLMIEAINQDHVQLYSLQKDIRAREDYDGRDLPKDIIDLEILLDSWEDTAGAIANLDLIISSCTSTAHLAGAMGKPTWIIVPTMMYYIWCHPGDKSPWYDSVTLFRQEVYGKWEQPFEKIKEALREWKK